MEGHIIIKTIYIGPLNYVKQNGYLKIFIGLVGGEGAFGEGGGLFAIQCFWSLKKSTYKFNFLSNELLHTSL
jgi:hypothetical protein